MQLIRMAVRYFQTQMKYRRVILSKRLEMSKKKLFVFQDSPSEIRYRNIMSAKRAAGKTLVRSKGSINE